jgi:hypothetical protein
MSDPHSIVIRPEPFGAGFDITVEPGPAWSNCNTERRTLREARRYAESLRVVHPAWPIRDETREAV